MTSATTFTEQVNGLQKQKTKGDTTVISGE